MRSSAVRLSLLTLALTSATVGCRSHAAAGAAGSASASPSVSAPASPSAQPAPPPAEAARLPEGPSLAIQAGKGVGPIRLGATVATIERLMGAPCEVRTPEVCRYIQRAVEFYLGKDGQTERIVVHRHERAAGLDAHGVRQVYGFFNGGIPPGAALGMVPKAIVEIIGPPQSSAQVTEKNAFDTVERATYPGGMVLEYDVYKNGKVMLGGVIISKPKE